MNKLSSSEHWILDASAVLAFLFEEPGKDVVATCLPGALMSTANLAEVLTKLSDREIASGIARQLVANLGLRIMPFTETSAHRAASLRAATKAFGLSLADRACLALAADLSLPVLTSDRQWSKVADALGLTVSVFR